MLVVKPWICVESCPGLICHTFCGVPGFSFSRTVGFGFDGAAIADDESVVMEGAAVGAIVASAAVVGIGLVAGVTEFVLGSNKRLIVLCFGGTPGRTSA